MERITVTIDFDPTLFESRAMITDSLNDTFHAIALSMELNDDPATGGYDGFDWYYDNETQREGIYGAATARPEAK